MSEKSKFCNECGAPVSSVSRSAEYKQLTVLFADVVRSMDIAARVDIERLREFMTELVDRAATVARRFGGSVEYTGDGVMALFGAPIALEDHAFRACVAALAIQDEVRQLAVEVQGRDGVALQVRVRLNSGRVIIDSGSLGQAATGEMIGFAQRMESAAPPGGVRVVDAGVLRGRQSSWGRCTDGAGPGRRRTADRQFGAGVARAVAGSSPARPR